MKLFLVQAFLFAFVATSGIGYALNPAPAVQDEDAYTTSAALVKMQCALIHPARFLTVQVLDDQENRQLKIAVDMPPGIKPFQRLDLFIGDNLEYQQAQWVSGGPVAQFVVDYSVLRSRPTRDVPYIVVLYEDNGYASTVIQTYSIHLPSAGE